ncbi:hypothetical protein HYPSUDRAFT_862395 [Hypholoma sublateritium FD-334 SS-4]|uniref:Uncharacterized protein n=1 Tax=Hypholoma sublateritium (strain FD-334 SS-4) TaxID=945553 RepID=A0A0D2LIX5_HYPSF|nr:hypothetical protein HYPSUDRAFT_862395 [Hypholoma sublateritium FD-334 SS-4]
MFAYYGTIFSTTTARDLLSSSSKPPPGSSSLPEIFCLSLLSCAYIHCYLSLFLNRRLLLLHICTCYTYSEIASSPHA